MDGVVLRSQVRASWPSPPGHMMYYMMFMPWISGVYMTNAKSDIFREPGRNRIAEYRTASQAEDSTTSRSRVSSASRGLPSLQRAVLDVAIWIQLDGTSYCLHLNRSMACPTWIQPAGIHTLYRPEAGLFTFPSAMAGIFGHVSAKFAMERSFQRFKSTTRKHEARESTLQVPNSHTH